MTLSGNDEEQFKGFFIQARLVADDTSRVGSFSVVDEANSKLSACTPANVSVAISLCYIIITNSTNNDTHNGTHTHTCMKCQVQSYTIDNLDYINIHGYNILYTSKQIVE